MSDITCIYETKGGEELIMAGSGRGFASMDEETRRAIASKGGRAAHRKGTAHEFSSEEAREAGRKGGRSRGNSSNSGDDI